MDQTALATITYFKGHRDYFWRWAEGGTVIEFANKRTICYREDLSNILIALPRSTALPLGTILLVFCACKDNWEQVFGIENMLDKYGYNNQRNQKPHYKLIQDAYGFLKLINQLPQKHRTDINRSALLQSIFDASANKGYHKELMPILSDFNTGLLDERIFGNIKPFSEKNLIEDLAPLAAASSIFQDPLQLELKLRTGLKEIPKPIVLAKVEQKNIGLLEELLQYEQTQHLSALAKKIMAALNIPMHLNGNSDQSLGGISDIANKGTYDRLLLSELAQDDLLLTARLANNEALFLKRESSPKQQHQELGIILDTTLKMWGNTRIFAIATSLAFREAKQKHQNLKMMTLSGRHIDVQELQTKDDAINLLEKMDIALHCGAQLATALTTHTSKHGKYIFITSDHFLKDREAMAHFAKVRDKLSYLVTISSAGQIQMMQLDKNRSKLIREANIDMQEVLTIPKKRKKNILQSDIPAILSEADFPLYYPTSKIRLTSKNSISLTNKTALAITKDRRVLYWLKKELGAVELANAIPDGIVCFGEISNIAFLMVVPDTSEPIKIYHFDLFNHTYVTLNIEVPHANCKEAKFIGNRFWFQSANQLTAIDAVTGGISQAEEGDQKRFNTYISYNPNTMVMGQLKRFINNGYSSINSLKNIYINNYDLLSADRRSLICNNDEFRWEEGPHLPQLGVIKQENIVVKHLFNINFIRFTFQSGSTATIDSRGFLHLKSIDPNIPEITIVTIIDKPTACWSADGFKSGSSYFTGFDQTNQLTPAIFENRYLKPFIHSLKTT